MSTQAVASFKPDPAICAHFLCVAGADAGETWLVSGSGFEVIGAMRAGWYAARLRRDPAAHFDPWGVTPSRVVDDLAKLVSLAST